MKNLKFILPAWLLFGLPWVMSLTKWNILASGATTSESVAEVLSYFLLIVAVVVAGGLILDDERFKKGE